MAYMVGQRLSSWKICVVRILEGGTFERGRFGRWEILGVTRLGRCGIWEMGDMKVGVGI